MRNVSINIVQKIKTLCVKKFVSKYLPFYEIMGKIWYSQTGHT